MGFRFRKSVNLGHGFRVNLSKSGVGYSWGTKGVRFTKTAAGKSRKTVSIPGTGLSYTTESKKTKVPSANKQGPSPVMNHPQKNNKNNRKTILLWCATVFFVLTALVYFPSFASLTALAISILLLPLTAWQDILHRYLHTKAKIAVSIILFVVTILLVPSTHLSEPTPSTDLPVSSTTSTAEENPKLDDSFAGSSTSDDTSSIDIPAENTTGSAVTDSHNETSNNTSAAIESSTNTSNATQKNESNNSSESNSESSSNTPDSVQQMNSESNEQNNAEASAPTDSSTVSQNQPDSTGHTYILNTNSKKFHIPSCSSVNNMNAANKKEYQGSRDDLINRGYEPCQRCKP